MILSIRTVLFLIAGMILHGVAYGQSQQKVLDVGPVTDAIVIDGKLSENSWANAAKAVGFTQNSPQPGRPSIGHTEVSVLYDNNAVYIGAILNDNPDSIYRQLSPRDQYDGFNTDVFAVVFDTYNDHQNAFEFLVTAAGVQVDAKMKFDGADYSWNAAWYSKVAITEKGWCVEMKIPYSALRFPKSAVQKWGLNFYRMIRRERENSYWSEVKPGIPNVLSQAGILNGIHDIVSPVRLTLLPYVSAYTENYAGANANSLNGGLDIKYGINESFTLDMTLVPDFGQTLFDNRVLNLSPIEVRYDERRYFFTEGFDLFNKNDLFYSRRVGGVPVNAGGLSSALLANEVVDENPANTKLYNAIKLSGRSKHNLGVGFFNAVSAPAEASILDTVTNTKRLQQTAPLTNYNVVVLDQALKNNSYISFINTNVLRKENSYNADVSALLFKFSNKKNTYGIDGSGDVSQLFRPTGSDVGYRYYFDVAKTSGNYTWYLKTRSISDRFNPNDLGYLDRNNLTYYIFEQYYNVFKPFNTLIGTINSAYNHLGIEYFRVFNPDVFQQFDFYGSHNITFKSFLTTGLYWSAMPMTGNDYNEPRTFGRFYQYPKNVMVGGFYSSDYRNRFALDLSGSNRWFSEGQRNSFSWEVSPRYRFSKKFSMIYSLNGENDISNVGYVASRNDSVFFGIRDVNTLTNTLDATYIFTNRMSLKVDARHYWSQANYSAYKLLNTDGTLGQTSENFKKNINFNSFNVFVNFVWQFKPGSEMSVVYQNSIYSSGQNLEPNYFNDIDYTFRAPQSNSLSVKIIYYLDYLTIKEAISKRG